MSWHPDPLLAREARAVLGEGCEPYSVDLSWLDGWWEDVCREWSRGERWWYRLLGTWPFHFAPWWACERRRQLEGIAYGRAQLRGRRIRGPVIRVTWDPADE